ncbi:MAG: hypothetical protein K9K81_10220, partial [Desulfobacteraceae bacterium]|nr:hypothetical protein [Desulfobacteraceae bacterium]
VQYLRYAQFLRISRTDKYAAFFEIAQALILNFLRHHLKSDFLRCHQALYCTLFAGIWPVAKVIVFMNKQSLWQSRKKLFTSLGGLSGRKPKAGVRFFRS